MASQGGREGGREEEEQSKENLTTRREDVGQRSARSAFSLVNAFFISREGERHSRLCLDLKAFVLMPLETATFHPTIDNRHTKGSFVDLIALSVERLRR